ncbi:penicillin acylase family protein [Flavobacterium sp. PL002]|uniref:penicillin acylase family protein n=1 Tax=Flavobacterium sp. PL002 TaxID=1897058 RepID=UPI0017879A3B|nr:penicillin acylase family protein [Flavobacterium sp. PL002]MBE0392658.1 Acyl-homoserine lactone acylase QuiP [Flavobacterium sp. PL002]
MKIIKKSLLVLVVVILFLAIAVTSYIFYLKPKYEGEVLLKDLNKETTVYFDDYGIPHIYADNPKDAMLALGYVHAQDRLWQMELMRRIAPGKLSAIFGSVAIDNDMFFAGLGIEEASAKAIATLDKNSPSYQLTMAYLDGINQYMDEEVTPIEFQLLGVKKEKFTIKDVYNIFGYMSFSFAMAQKSDPLMTDIRNKYGMEYLKDLGIDGAFNSVKIKNSKSKPEEYAAISKSVAALLNKSPIPPFIGSNSWVIGGKKTKSGKVLFANDPHIGFSQPGTWYEAHIVTPEFELYGCYLAGTPFPLLAHNRDYAYGLTMFENDDIDLYQEENNSANANQYKTPTGFADYTIIKKTIKVKDTSDYVLNVKWSRHGPIMNDLIKGLNSKNPVAMSWIYTQQPIQILDAVYTLSHAKNINDFQRGVKLIAAPGLNIMYGDAKGNVAWWATGKLYKHKEGVNSNFILNGASGNDDIQEFLDFSKNPSAMNPDWDYVYSANNQPEAVDGFLYPGYYLPEDRAKRITDLLDPKSDWDKETVSKMLTDNTSPVSPIVAAKLIHNLALKKLTKNEGKALEYLKNWSGRNDVTDIAPTIYNKWIYFYLKNTFEDELGADGFEQFLGTHIMKQAIAKLLENEKSLWWDNVTTKGKKETRSEIVSQSFKEAVASLEKQLGNTVEKWTWSTVHNVEFKHPLSKVAALRKIFNVGPFAVSGSNEVINNQMFHYTNDKEYTVTGGPSTRRIVDFSDVENSWSILPTGQSGNPFSKHYDDQAKLYNEGKFRKMKMNKEEIVKTGTKLVFKAK